MNNRLIFNRFNVLLCWFHNGLHHFLRPGNGLGGGSQNHCYHACNAVKGVLENCFHILYYGTKISLIMQVCNHINV